MATTDELVTLSGVSRSTVFRFMRGGTVRPPARAAILSAMQQLNIVHRETPSNTGNLLQISVRRDFRSFKGYGQAIAGFMARAESFGFQVTLQMGNPILQDDLHKLKRKQEKKPVGVLILGMTMEEEEYEIKCFNQAGIPHVFINRIFEDPSVSWVSCDLRAAARGAVEHLLDLGHSDIGTWGVLSTSRIDRIKREGFIDAFKARNLSVPECCLDQDKDGDLEEAVQKLVDTKKLPRAWFCASDEHAMRFIKVARTNKLSIPEDIALVSMDDVESSEYLNPALTTVRMPFQTEGTLAFDALKHLIENPDEVSQRILVKHTLIVRESCGANKGKDVAL